MVPEGSAKDINIESVTTARSHLHRANDLARQVLILKVRKPHYPERGKDGSYLNILL